MGVVIETIHMGMHWVCRAFVMRRGVMWCHATATPAFAQAHPQCSLSIPGLAT
jgi:hypothetical protein